MASSLILSLTALSKARGFAVVAVLTLAIGIGATTAIFSTLRALVISPFSYPESARLVHVWSGDSWSLSPADSLDLQEQSTSFAAFGVYRPESYNVGREKAESVLGAKATSGVLRAFDVAPTIGRLFEPADDVYGAPPVVILSYGLWQRMFAGDPQVIGRMFPLNGNEAKIVGVMPASFEFASSWMRTSDCMLWTPLTFDSKESKNRDSHYLLGLARLKEGVSVATADAELKTIGQRLTALYPNSNTGKKFLLRSLHDEMTKDLGSKVWLLFGAVALLLLVACGNVASMLLARGARRQGEFSIRLALGASRGQLAKLVLTESALLALGGAVVGVGLAFAGVEVLRVLAPVGEARKAAISVDGLALGFTLAATVLTALVAGLPPALAAMQTSISAAMNGDARGAIGSRSRHHMLRSLIISQIAIAFLLANGAVLFSRSYLKIIEENQLLATDAVITASIGLNGERYKENAARVQFWYAVLTQLEAIPGVTHAAITSKLPLEGGNNTNGLVNDETFDPTQNRLQIERSSVTEDYFASMGLRLLKGRNLKPEDRQGEIRGVVVNEEMVRRAWPKKDPIGEIIRGNNPGQPWYTARVIGVVENVRQEGATSEIQPEMYTTPEGHWGRDPNFVLRSSLPTDQLLPLLRRAVAMVDPELPLKDLRTMRDVVGKATKGDRAVTGLVNFFMAAALGLVAVGLYGTLSYHVQQRTREIGVRLAVGAQKQDIARLVFSQGGRWVLVGLTLGLIGSIALASSLKSLIYQMDGLSALPLALASVTVGLAAFVACWLPARRATRLDPLVALRAD